LIYLQHWLRSSRRAFEQNLVGEAHISSSFELVNQQL